MVGMWSKYVKAFPAKHASRHAVTNALLTEIIPSRGTPGRISSDQGTHFVSTALTQVNTFLGIDMRRHCVFHPQSGGTVERENGMQKMKLTKCCEETSPYEILFRHPPSWA